MKKILDVGCAEGYATSFISKKNTFVVGVELDPHYLSIAKEKVKSVEFVNASLEHLPFREGVFDAVCVLEVLEHLDSRTQRAGLVEMDRILRIKGDLIISVPYKENIVHTRCIHCGKTTPLYGHLHSLDETNIDGLLPAGRYKMLRTYRMVNAQVISCSRLFKSIPLPIWLLLNNVLGLVGKGYWIVLNYSREL